MDLKSHCDYVNLFIQPNLRATFDSNGQPHWNLQLNEFNKYIAITTTIVTLQNNIPFQNIKTACVGQSPCACVHDLGSLVFRCCGVVGGGMCIAHSLVCRGITIAEHFHVPGLMLFVGMCPHDFGCFTLHALKGLTESK